MSIAKVLFVVAALAVSTQGLAQGQVFHEVHHPHGRLNPNNQGSSSYSGTVIHIPSQKWINYHGALAWNDRGATGISENARSERAARREALRKCGARDCRIAAWARNGCLAAAFDGIGSGVGAEGTKEAAEEEAMRNCQANGSTTCRINYSHCNHPVRIR